MGCDTLVDAEMEPDPTFNRMTNAIIGAAIEVHRALGPGHLESVYENAVAVEFDLRGIPYRRQFPIELAFKGHVVGEGRLDFLVHDCVVLELKAVESFAPVHRAQMIGYLKITGHKLGMLINFNVPALKDGIRRIAN